MLGEDAETISSLLEGFGLLNLDCDFITSIRRGDMDAVNNEYGDNFKIDVGCEGSLKDLEKRLRHYRQNDAEHLFWAALRERDISPFAIEAICVVLFSKESELFNHGLIIYTILLGMSCASQVWNPILFGPVLSALISAQQILENGPQSAEDADQALELCKTILKELTIAFTENFAGMISQEVLVAICEITAKLMTGFRADLDSWNTRICEAAMSVGEKILQYKKQYFLPFLVPVMLLQFAAATTTTFTARLDKTRERLLEFLLRHVENDDPDLVNFCKHLIVRAPEKAHLRKSAAFVVLNLSELSDAGNELIEFVLKYARSAKVTSRAFAVSLLQLYLVNVSSIVKLDDDKIPGMVMEMANTIKRAVSDVAPTVRAAALDAVSYVIASLSGHPYTQIIENVIDCHGSLKKTLHKRIIDDKLVVRRAALNCVSELMKNAQELDKELLDLISGRVRDRALSIRQQAIRTLNAAIDLFPLSDELIMTWLDSILPVIVDTENSVQNEAFDSVRRKVLEPIEAGSDDVFGPKLTEEHFDFMKNVFQLYKQRAISLKKLSVALSQRVQDDFTDRPAWKLAKMLSDVETLGFKSNLFVKLWENRDELPPEYFHILANLKCVDEDMRTDCLSMFEGMLKANECDYARMNGLLDLLRVETEKDSGDATWNQLLSRCCNIVNTVVQSERASPSDLMGLLTTIYALGELILLVKDSKTLGNYEFLGVEILLSEELPNHTVVPDRVRSMSVVTVAKLCLRNRSLAVNLNDAFAAQLVSISDAPLKCNCLVALCDLCMEYTAMVEPHTKMMTNCFADPSINVRRQALHLITKLVVEGYLKMSILLFFKYVWAMTDPVPEIAWFAQRCLFNVIITKYPDILTANFIDTIYFCTGEVDLSLDETKEEIELFRNWDIDRRREGLELIISRLNETAVFTLVDGLFKRVLHKFTTQEFSLQKHSKTLSDSIFALIKLEDKMKAASDQETTTENTEAERIIEAGKRMINDIHTTMIQSVLPVLNELHKMLRINHSPYQGQLKEFYQRICEKNPNLLEQIAKNEPLLAEELREEMEKTAELDTSLFTPPSTPKRKGTFTSPLLSKIAETPRSRLTTPGKPLSDQKEETSDILVTPKRTTKQKEFSTPPHGTVDLD